jgi:ATP-dependent DNA helicase DinG
VFGGTDYDDQLVRLKLKQAFGRLIRRADDRGVFVLLDRQMPSRLLGAFPEEIRIDRLGLADVIERTRSFLDHYRTPG